MRRFLTLLFVVFFIGTAFAVPCCHAVTIESENSFCIYGVSGITINIEAGNSMVDYTFPNGSTHFDNPYIITESQIRDWYSEGLAAIHIYANPCSSITLTTADSVPSAISPDGISGTSTDIVIGADDGRPLSFTTKLLALKRMYLFPTGTYPVVAGVEPTPFVNDGEDIVVDDTHIKSTIGAVNDFQPFVQFIFSTVIPWAAVAGVVILVLATIKFMLKG